MKWYHYVKVFGKWIQIPEWIYEFLKIRGKITNFKDDGY
jgi:hypothetical protein